MIESLNEYLDKVTYLAGNLEDVWYRGINDVALEVQPGLYWRGIDDESDITSEFLVQAPQFAEVTHKIMFLGELEAPWEWYFLMQHYGLPTRLVDWSESPLIAIYFALMNYDQCSENERIPGVWVLDPSALNSLSIDYSGVIMPSGKFSQHWLYQTDSTDDSKCTPGHVKSFDYNGTNYSNENPIAIVPVRTNKRIVAQQGVFTVHGTCQKGLDKIMSISAGPEQDKSTGLHRIEISPERVEVIKKQLEIMKIHELALFPELPNLSNSILNRKLLRQASRITKA